MTIPEDALTRLRDRFLHRCRDQLALLKDAADSGRPLSVTKDDGALLKTVHSLAGTGGTFGFPEISARASELETLLIEKKIDSSSTQFALLALIGEIESQLS